MKLQRSDFTNHEQAILRAHYETDMPLEDLLALLPRHTRHSILRHANRALGLRRPMARPKPSPSWDRICALLEVRPMTQKQLAEAMGITQTRVSELIRRWRPQVRIVAYLWPEMGRPMALFALGAGVDAPLPMGAQRAMALRRRIACPMGSMVAAAQLGTTLDSWGGGR